MDNVIALLLPPMLLMPAMGILSAIRSSGALGHELKRKALHLATGLVALAFPAILTETWMVCGAAAIVFGWMLAVRCVPRLRRRFGACLYDAGRASHGELYFVVALVALLLLAETPVGYVIPLMILTLADAAAAVVGRALPAGRLGGPAAGKTLSGSLAFLVVAFLVTGVALIVLTNLDIAAVLWTSAGVAAVTCLCEAVSRRGLDNLLVPMAAMACLWPLDRAVGANGLAALDWIPLTIPGG